MKLRTFAEKIEFMSKKLYYTYGAMGSSKTAQLLMNAYSMQERGIPFLCLKPSLDDRDGVGIIKSRVGISRECIAVERDVDLYEFINAYVVNASLEGVPKPLWILVDECQFLTARQVEQLSDVVDYLGINVICYGLRADFCTQSFEGSKRLFELADNISEIKVSCKCGRKAVVNARIDAYGEIVTNGEQVMIGGDAQYISMCRRCYKEAVKKKKERENGNYKEEEDIF